MVFSCDLRDAEESMEWRLGLSQFHTDGTDTGKVVILKHGTLCIVQCRIGRRKPPYQNQLDSLSHFVTMPEYDRYKHMTTANMVYWAVFNSISLSDDDSVLCSW